MDQFAEFLRLRTEQQLRCGTVRGQFGPLPTARLDQCLRHDGQGGGDALCLVEVEQELWVLHHAHPEPQRQRVRLPHMRLQVGEAVVARLVVQKVEDVLDAERNDGFGAGGGVERNRKNGAKEVFNVALDALLQRENKKEWDSHRMGARQNVV